MSNTIELTCTEGEFYEVMKESALGREWIRWHSENPKFFEYFEEHVIPTIIS